MIPQEDSYKHRGLRKSLVKALAKRGIESKDLLDAVQKVPRHYFFDPAFLTHAYEDKAFPIGQGQTISQPYTVCFQTELLNVRDGDKVLEIGTGSGYQACILCELGADVYTIEYNSVLYDTARKQLKHMGYSPHFKQGDGTLGWKSQAPFDKILVTAGAPRIPKDLVDQLKVGGDLVIPVGGKDRQKMVLIHKESDQKVTTEEFNYFAFVPLLGEQGWNQ